LSVTKTFNVTLHSFPTRRSSDLDVTLSAGPVTLTATATSALAVSYTSNSTSICTVSGSSVTLVIAGICSITANQAGNASFAAATAVTKTFNDTVNSNVIKVPHPA